MWDSLRVLAQSDLQKGEEEIALGLSQWGDENSLKALFRA